MLSYEVSHVCKTMIQQTENLCNIKNPTLLVGFFWDLILFAGIGHIGPCYKVTKQGLTHFYNLLAEYFFSVAATCNNIISYRHIFRKIQRMVAILQSSGCN